MADLAQLLVRIDATTEQLRRELARADAAVTASQRNIDAKLGLIDTRFSKASTAVTAFAGGLVRGLVPALGAITAIQAGRSIGDLTVGLVRAGDEIRETALSLDLSTDALQEYRHALSLSGVTAEEFERAIKFMNNAVGTFARTGKGEAAAALNELGLATEFASGRIKGADAQFLAIIDSLGKVGDAQRRASLEADLLGQKVGPKFAAAIDDGVAALLRERQAVHDLGLVMNEEAIARADRLADAWIRLGAAAEGVGVRIGTLLLPALEGLSDILGDLAGSRPEEPLLDLQEQIEGLTAAQAALIDQMNEAPSGSPEFERYKEQVNALNDEILILQKRLEGLRQAQTETARPPVTLPAPGDVAAAGGTPRASQAALLDAEIQKMERQAVLLREQQLTSEQISAVLSQEFQTAENGVEVFNAMAQANRDRLTGAIANLDAAKNEAAFLDRLRQAQGQNVSATLGFDSAELRDAAVAAQELGFNIQNISSPAEFKAWLEDLPAQTQSAIEAMVRVQEVASNIEIGQQLGAQLAALELANSTVNQQTESYRVQAQILQIELQTQRQITDAQRDKVAAIQEQITAQRQAQALLDLERETAAAQQRIGAAGDPREQLMSRLTGGLAPQESRVQGRLDQAALQGIDPATIEASVRQFEELNTQMAIAETVSSELARGATELGTALAFEGVDEAGERLSEMLQNLIMGLTEAIIQALIFRAIMAAISGPGMTPGLTPTPAPGQTGPGGMLGHAQKGGHFEKGRRISVAEDRKTELWVPDALTPPHFTPRDVPALATATELPEIAVRRLSASRSGRVLLGIVSGGGEPLAGSTEIGEGGDIRNVIAPAGVALLGAEGRPEIILATTAGTVLPNPDVVALQSSPAGRSFLRQMEQRQLGGPIQAGKPYQVGEAGRELLVEGDKARLIGVSGREVIVPKANSIVFPHADTERFMTALPGVQPGRQGAMPEDANEQLMKMLPGLQAGGWATAMPPMPRPPAAPVSSGAPNVSFQVIDQRGKDAPPIETTTQTMPDGRVMAVAIVRAARAEMARTGEDQEYMRRQFGIGPRPR